MKKVFIIIALLIPITGWGILPPARPTLLYITDTTMVLKWENTNCCTCVAAHIIYRDDGSGYDSVGWAPGDSGIMTYSGTGMSGLLPDKKYRYRVCVKCAINPGDTACAVDSMFTTKVILTKALNTFQGGKDDGYTMYSTIPFPTPPLIIERATLLYITDTTMILKWEDKTCYEDGYLIYRDEGAGYDSIGWHPPASGIVTYSGQGMSGLNPDKKYRYRVCAYNATDTTCIVDSMFTTKVILTKALNTFQGGKDDGYTMYSTIPFPTPPLIIERATLLYITDTTMILKWEDKTCYENGYLIYRNEGTGYDSIGAMGPGSGIMTYSGAGMSGLNPDKKYRYRVCAYNTENTICIIDSMFTTKVILTKALNTYQGSKDDGYDMCTCVSDTSSTGIESPVRLLPTVYSLSQNIPNPFKTSTLINYAIPEKCHICLCIYDLTGRVVSTLVDEVKKPGYYKIHWDGRDAHGKKLPCGIYFYQLKNGVHVSPRKIIILQ